MIQDERVHCNACETVMLTTFTMMDLTGGKLYCEECIDSGKVPEGHPQHPDSDVVGL